MVKKIFIILFLFIFLQHCEYKPVYSNIDNLDFNLNIIGIDGDKEMNDLVIANTEKYANLSSGKIFNIKIKTNYTKEPLVRNKKGEITTFLLNNEIIFEILNDEVNEVYIFTEKLKTKNNNDKFEFKKYEKSIKNNFVNSKINELILKLSSL